MKPSIDFIQASVIPDLSQAQAIGQGFDIYGDVSMDSVVKPLFNFDTMPKQTITFYGKEVQVPKFVIWHEGSMEDSDEGYVISRSTFQEKMSNRVGVSTHAGAFSGEVESTFKASSSSSEELTYTYKRVYQLLGSFQYSPGFEAYFHDDFVEAVQALPPDVTEQTFEAFERFFNTFGVYYLDMVALGAKLTYGTVVSKSSSMQSEDIRQAFTLSYNALFAGGKISKEQEQSRMWTSYMENAEVRITIHGGDSELSDALIADADPKKPVDMRPDRKAWAASVKSHPANIDFRLKPIWKLALPNNRGPLIERAWNKFSSRLRPTLDLTTTVASWPEKQVVRRPTVRIHDEDIDIRPDENKNMGIVALIFDGSDLAAPPLLKVEFGMEFNHWPAQYETMWTRLKEAVDKSNAAKIPNLLVLTGYNFEFNAPPPQPMVKLLEKAGADRKRLYERWLDCCRPGHRRSEFAVNAMNIAFAGFFGGAEGSAVEVYRSYAENPMPRHTSVSIAFSRETYGMPYRIDAVDIEG